MYRSSISTLPKDKCTEVYPIASVPNQYQLVPIGSKCTRPKTINQYQLVGQVIKSKSKYNHDRPSLLIHI